MQTENYVTKLEFHSEIKRLDRRIEVAVGRSQDFLFGKMAEIESRMMRTLSDQISAVMVVAKEGYELLDAKIEALSSRVGALETRMDSLETRMDSLETRLDSLETRMDSVESRMASLEIKIDSNHTELLQRIDRVDTQFIHLVTIIEGLAR